MFKLESKNDILIDLSNKIIFKDEYYKICVLSIIDSIIEGENCCHGKCKKYNDRKFRLVFMLDKNINTNDVINYKEFSNKLNCDYLVVREDYECIYNHFKKAKYIILSNNILSFFAVKENINDIEDMIVVAFEYGLLNKKEIKKLSNSVDIYKEFDNFYIINPLLKSEYLLISDLNLIKE
jgi:hypothetical protein